MLRACDINLPLERIPYWLPRWAGSRNGAACLVRFFFRTNSADVQNTYQFTGSVFGMIRKSNWQGIDKVSEKNPSEVRELKKNATSPWRHSIDIICQNLRQITLIISFCENATVAIITITVTCLTLRHFTEINSTTFSQNLTECTVLPHQPLAHDENVWKYKKTVRVTWQTCENNLSDLSAAWSGAFSVGIIICSNRWLCSGTTDYYAKEPSRISKQFSNCWMN
jgi:hypothetical protein